MALDLAIAMSLTSGGKASGPNNTHAYRYYRVNATNSTAGAIGIAEIELAATVGGADTSAGRVYSANTVSVPGTTDADKAFDDNTGTLWASTGLPGIVKADYGATAGNWVAVNQLKITARNDGAFTQSPSDFTLEGSDNDAAWTVLITRTGLTWTQGETKTFTV